MVSQAPTTDAARVVVHHSGEIIAMAANLEVGFIADPDLIRSINANFSYGIGHTRKKRLGAHARAEEAISMPLSLAWRIRHAMHTLPP